MIINDVFTKKQTIINYSLLEIAHFYRNDGLIFRHINQLHVRSIKKYITENIQSEQIYFPPIVATIEKNSLCNEKPEKLFIIDGSQRLAALIQLNNIIIKAINSEEMLEIEMGYRLQRILENTELVFQILEGLSKVECDQLYIDLNTKGKAVSLSKRISYDSRSELNEITNGVLETNQELQIAGVEMEKRAIMRPKNKNLLSLSQLRQIVGIFLSGKLVRQKLEVQTTLSLQSSEYIGLINEWLECLFTVVPAKSIGNYHETILASFPVLLSIAIYVNRDSFSCTFQERKETIKGRMKSIEHIDWSRENPIWLKFSGSQKGKENYYYLKMEKENLDRIVDWLLSVKEVNSV